MNNKEIYNPEKIKAENLMEPLYRYDAHGNYNLEIGYEYLPKEELMCHEFWRIVNKKLENLRKEILLGNLTPLHYLMEKNFLDPFSFSKFVGIPLWRVRRHLRPAVFSRLKKETLQIYTDAFDISVDELFSLK